MFNRVRHSRPKLRGAADIRFGVTGKKIRRKTDQNTGGYKKGASAERPAEGSERRSGEQAFADAADLRFQGSDRKDAVHLQGSGVQAAVFAGCGKKRRCGLYQRDKDGSTGAGADRKGYPEGDGGGIGVVLGL